MTWTSETLSEFYAPLNVFHFWENTPLVSCSRYDYKSTQVSRERVRGWQVWTVGWAERGMKGRRCWCCGVTGWFSGGPAVWSSWLNSVWKSQVLQPAKQHCYSHSGKSSVWIKAHTNAWCALQRPWCCRRQGRRAKTAGNTGSPARCPHTGSHWINLQGDQTGQCFCEAHASQCPAKST